MPGYLTHAMTLIKMEEWLGQLETKLKEKRASASGGRLPVFEQRVLELAEKTRFYLRIGSTSAGQTFPVTNIEDPGGNSQRKGKGDGISKYAFVGSIGAEFPAAANILALHQRWVYQTMHLGSPRRAWTDAGSTRFALHFIDAVNAEFPQPERKRAMMGYAVGHLCGVATDVLLSPFVNQWVWTQPNMGDGRALRQEFELALDAKVSDGFFQRADMQSGQSWEDYYLEKGDFENEIKRLMEVYFECFKRTYSGPEPLEQLCGTSATSCTHAKLDADFLIDGYRNTTNWAIDMGYDQTPYWPKLLWATGILGMGMYLVYDIWSSTEDYSSLFSKSFHVNESEVGEVKEKILKEWIDDGIGGDHILYRMLGSSYSAGGALFTVFGLLLSGVPIIWPSGLFGQGAASSPTWIKIYSAVKFPGLWLLDKILEGTVPKGWDNPWRRWLWFWLLSVGPDVFDYLYTNKRSEEDGKEGNIIAQKTFWPKVLLAGGYFLSALTVFGFKSLRQKDGHRESTGAAEDYLVGAILPIFGTCLILGEGWFDTAILKDVAGAKWPDTNTVPVNRFLPITVTDGSKSFTPGGGDGLPVSLFKNNEIVPVGDRKHFPEADDAVPYAERARKNEEARKGKSAPVGNYKLSTLLDQAARLAGLLAMAAVNYDEASANEKERAKFIFRDWNLDYRTIEEWSYLVEPVNQESGQVIGLEVAGTIPGLMQAAERWWKNLENPQQPPPAENMMQRLREVFAIADPAAPGPGGSISLQLKYEDGAPMADAEFEAVFGDQRVSGRTDATGAATIAVPVENAETYRLFLLSYPEQYAIAGGTS